MSARRFRVVTVAREYGSGGAAIAKALAARLGYQLLDRALVERIAAEARIDPDLAEKLDEHVDPWARRIGRALWYGGFEAIAVVDENDVVDSDRVAALGGRVVEEAAAAGGCVIVGRGGQCLLRGRPDVFHVFVYAPREERLRRLRARLGPGADVELALEETDRERTALHPPALRREPARSPPLPPHGQRRARRGIGRVRDPRRPRDGHPGPGLTPVSADALVRPRVVNPWIVAVAVMSATFMEVLDTTVVNVSLPHIAGDLSATIDESTWALTSYLVANAIILPLAGWLSNQFGRKRLLMLSVSGFTVASLLCGLAPTLPFLILFRVIQGMTGGALQPLSQAVLLEAFPPEQRGKAMGFWGLGIVVAPIFGPVLGGWLTDSYSWRWVFYINLPVGIVALVMMKLFVFDPAYIGKRGERVDWTGIGLLALGIGALQIFLDKGQEDDWFASRLMTTLAIVSAFALAAFLVHELRVEHPVVDLRVFRLRTYATGVFLITMVGFVLYGSLVLLPIFLQTLLGYPSLQAGIAMSPRGMGSFIAMPLVGLLLGRVDARRLLGPGARGRLGDAVLVRLAEPADGVLGRLLAAVRAGHLARPPVRAAHHHHHGPHPAGVDGQRHQHLQPHAQHRGQPRHRRGHDAPRASPAGPHERPRRARRRLQPPGAGPPRPAPRRVRGPGVRPRDRHATGPRRRLRPRAAAGGHAVVHRRVPPDGAVLRLPPAAPLPDEDAAGGSRARGPALKPRRHQETLPPSLRGAFVPGVAEMRARRPA